MMGKFIPVKTAIIPAIIAGTILTASGGAPHASAGTVPGIDAQPVSGISAEDTAAAEALRISIVHSRRESGVVTESAGGWYRCPSGYMCLFDGFTGTGTMAYFRTGSPNLGWQGIDKAASSQWNRSPWHFVLYEGYNYSGRHNGTEPPGTWWNFTYATGNNFFSSIRRQ
jgi:hypothetical protein